jgi:hypothetical protein
LCGGSLGVPDGSQCDQWPAADVACHRHHVTESCCSRKDLSTRIPPMPRWHHQRSASRAARYSTKRSAGLPSTASPRKDQPAARRSCAEVSRGGLRSLDCDSASVSFRGGRARSQFRGGSSEHRTTAGCANGRFVMAMSAGSIVGTVLGHHLAGAAVDRASHRRPWDNATASAAMVTITMMASRITVPTVTAV